MIKTIGKEKTTAYFEKIVSKNTLGHLYILEGPQGIGKQTLARHISAQIHCEGDSQRPCGVCGACIKHKAGSHPDMHVIENKDSTKKSIGVETVRGFTSEIFVKPLIAGTGIYIVPEAQTLSPQAQNALLKILEEPPSFALIMLLTTSREALLPTVISRGIICPVEPCTREETVLYIKEHFPDRSDMAEMIADFSGGILGVAREMLKEETSFQVRQDLYSALSSAGANPAEQFTVVSCFEKYKSFRQLLFDLTISWLRDVLYTKTVKGDRLINYDYKKEIQRFADGMSLSEALTASAYAVESSSRIGTGSNLNLWVTDLMIKCFNS